MVGWFLYGKPVLSINSLDLVKRILIADFSFFTDRLSAGLFESGGHLDKASPRGSLRATGHLDKASPRDSLRAGDTLTR